MVSLGDDNRRQGGYFFDQPDASSSFSHQDSDDSLLEASTLSAEIEPRFRAVKTVWAISFLLLLSLVIEVLVFVLPKACVGWTCGIDAFDIAVYCHAGFWCIVVAIDRYLRYQHYISRTNGYLDFYRKTRNIRRVPLMVYSGGNVILTVVLMAMYHHCQQNDNKSCLGTPLHPINFLQILLSLEAGVSIPVTIVYLVWTVKFNRRRASPDVHQDDNVTTFTQAHNQSGEVGFKDENFLDDVLEKQADMIRYLKQHNAHLGKKILRLTAQLNERSSLSA